MSSIVTPVPRYRHRTSKPGVIRAAEQAVKEARQHLLALLRDELLWRDGPRCHYCDQDTHIPPVALPNDWNHDRDRTVDHMVPVDRGGKDETENLVICCKRCNSEKGTLPYEVFLARRRPVRIHLGTTNFRQGQRIQHHIFGMGIVVTAGAETVGVFGHGGVGR